MFEYNYRFFNALDKKDRQEKRIKDQAEQMSKEGWELVCVYPSTFEGDRVMIFTAFFRRVVK